VRGRNQQSGIHWLLFRHFAMAGSAEVTTVAASVVLVAIV
jgi:hypothetical protein